MLLGTTISSCFSSLSETHFSQLESELGELELKSISWLIWEIWYSPLPVRYTLLSEICDEQGRRLAYINGWVFWVVGMATIPFIGLQMLFCNFYLYLYTSNIKSNVEKKNNFSFTFYLTSAVSKVAGWLVQLWTLHNSNQPPHSFHASSYPGES